MPTTTRRPAGERWVIEARTVGSLLVALWEAGDGLAPLGELEVREGPVAPAELVVRVALAVPGGLATPIARAFSRNPLVGRDQRATFITTPTGPVPRFNRPLARPPRPLGRRNRPRVRRHQRGLGRLRERPTTSTRTRAGTSIAKIRTAVGSPITGIRGRRLARTRTIRVNSPISSTKARFANPPPMEGPPPEVVLPVGIPGEGPAAEVGAVAAGADAGKKGVGWKTPMRGAIPEREPPLPQAGEGNLSTDIFLTGSCGVGGN